MTCHWANQVKLLRATGKAWSAICELASFVSRTGGYTVMELLSKGALIQA